MIRAECEACRAPFKIDPRKMPEPIIMMRCPRCGCAFQVSREARGSRVDPRASTPRR